MTTPPPTSLSEVSRPLPATGELNLWSDGHFVGGNDANGKRLGGLEIVAEVNRLLTRLRAAEEKVAELMACGDAFEIEPMRCNEFDLEDFTTPNQEPSNG